MPVADVGVVVGLGVVISPVVVAEAYVWILLPAELGRRREIER